jgi:hypothetical protein
MELVPDKTLASILFGEAFKVARAMLESPPGEIGGGAAVERAIFMGPSVVASEAWRPSRDVSRRAPGDAVP